MHIACLSIFLSMYKEYTIEKEDEADWCEQAVVVLLAE